MEPKVLVRCFYCGKDTEKLAREYRRRIKKDPNVRFFCNLTCFSFVRNKEHPSKGNPELLKKYSDNRRDQFTPFRMFLKGAQNRNKDCDLSLEFLKTLWEKQKGICPITGWQLVLPHHSAKRLNKRNMYAASLDRIDCSQGYLKSNVRFVAYIANIARNVFSEQELLTFCKAVVAK